MPRIRLGCFECHRSMKEDPQSSIRFDDQGGYPRMRCVKLHLMFFCDIPTFLRENVYPSTG